MCHLSSVMCHLSPVMCRVSPVICHMLITSTAIAMDHPPANSPTIHSRVVNRDKKATNKINKKDYIMSILQKNVFLPKT